MKKIWLTWEDHRRSRELAQALGAIYFPLTSKKSRIIRYPLLTIKTLSILNKERPELVYCQNPSIILNLLLIIFRRIFSYKIISDRHSNFKFNSKNSKNPKWKLFHLISEFTAKKSDLVIVTNLYLKNYVENLGGKAIILQDKLPTLLLSKPMPLKGKYNFLFVSTFSDDEPIVEIIEAARATNHDHHFYITGNYKKYKNIDQIIEKLPGNVSLTGFVDEVTYQSLVASCDVIIVITDMEYTLTCGAYEAVSLEKAMILSDTSTIKEYFSQGAIYAKPTPSSLGNAIKLAVDQLPELQEQTVALKQRLISDWNTKFAQLLKEESKIIQGNE